MLNGKIFMLILDLSSTIKKFTTYHLPFYYLLTTEYKAENRKVLSKGPRWLEVGTK